MKVLFVGNLPFFQQITDEMKDTRPSWNFSVTRNPLEVLELVDIYSIDVVVVEYELSPMTGLDVLQWIRRKGKKLPFIIITNEPQSNAVELCNSGANFILNKASSEKKILNELTTAIEVVTTSPIMGSLSVEQRALIEGLQYCSFDLILVLEVNLVVVWANRVWYEKVGYNIKDSGVPLDNVHPDERPLIEERLQELITGRVKEVKGLMIRFKDQHGEYRWFEHNIILVGEQSDLRILVIARDVNDRIVAEVKNKEAELRLEQSEELLRKVYESSPVPIVVIDLSGFITDVNSASVALIDCHNKEELVGRSGKDFLPPMDVRDYEKRIDSLVKNGFEEFDLEITSQSGRTYRGKAYAAVILDRNANPTSIVGFFQDMTHILEQEREKELFLNIITHDLRNFFLTAKSYLNLVIRPSDDPQMKQDFVKGASQAIMQAQTVLDNITVLMKSNIDPKHQLIPINVEQAVNDVIHTVEQLFPSKMLKFNVNVQSDIYVQADVLFGQLVLNLITNAVKYDPKEEVEVMIDCKKGEGGERVLLQVIDHGRGIPEDQRSELFLRFVTFKKNGLGSGLGLFIVKTLTERYGGEVWIENRVQGDHTKGSVVNVTLNAVDYLKLLSKDLR